MMEHKFIRNFGLILKCQHAFFIFLVGVALSFGSVDKSFANNLQLDNFEVYSINSASNTITFTVDVNWDNSWKTGNNHDAVWIFLKYSTNGGSTWAHATMGGSGLNPNSFTAPAGYDVIVPQDQRGFFVQRSSLGSGSASAESVRFVWNYGQDNLSDAVALASNTINRIFGIEMAYVPEGSFYAGDGNSSSDYRFKQGSSDNDPWYIQSESAITTTNTPTDGFYYQGAGATGENNSGDVFVIPTSFPKGHHAFYMMKYELTEGQWVGFFNTLSPAQKLNRDITSSSNGGKNSDSVVNRNTIVWDSSSPKSDAETSRKDRPMTYISWPDLLAYADWAGLRPASELEFEKAARGSDIAAVTDELAWGKSTHTDVQSNEISPDSDETGTETISNGSANLNRNSSSWTTGDGRVGGAAESQKGPLRGGIFAGNSTSRVTSGAGYYGVMELSGNLNEMIVSLGNSAGRQFLGTHGDGTLSSVSNYEGNATNNDWPGINSTDSAYGITGTSGSGYRGGDFNSANIRFFQISTRTDASRDPDNAGKLQRYDASFGIFQGGRLVRTAP